jgi:hypothetical protein
MATPTATQIQNQNQGDEEKSLIDYHPIGRDYGHLSVTRLRDDGSREIIGYLYTEIDGEELRYISVNTKGRVLFPATTDFNTVTRRFERYARQIALDKGPTYLQLQKDNYSLTKNLNQMQSQTTDQKPKKVNQLIFTEYEKPAGDGHFITVNDSYHNVLGRIHKSYNEELRKYEYLAYDHAGYPMGKNDKLWQLKNEFVQNRDLLLEQAHQRRIAAKEKVKENPEQIPQASKTNERKSETEKLRQNGTTQERSVAKSSSTGKQNNGKTDEREGELEDLRDNYEDDPGDIER